MMRTDPDRRRLLAGGAALLSTGASPPADSSIAPGDIKILADGLQGPEGPTVLPDGGVALVEFTTGNVVRIWPDGRRQDVARIGTGLAGSALGRDGKLYLVRLNRSRVPTSKAGAPGGTDAGQIARVDLSTGETKVLYDAFEGAKLAGPDDLIVDRWGDLWWADVLEGAVYWGRADGGDIRRVIPAAPRANGITASPNRRTLYIVSGGALLAYDIAERGALVMEGGAPRQRVIAVLPTGLREPDGMKTEAGGNIVLACWKDGLLVVAPGGRTVAQVRLPGLEPVNMAFGGPRKRTLFVAASSGGPQGWNGQGKLVAIPWARPGL